MLFPQTPEPTDPDVSKLSKSFADLIGSSGSLSISCKGQLVRDRDLEAKGQNPFSLAFLTTGNIISSWTGDLGDTFFWSLFTDKFGSNPNTPYMWNALPAFGFLLPSPMWNLRPGPRQIFR